MRDTVNAKSSIFGLGRITAAIGILGAIFVIVMAVENAREKEAQFQARAEAEHARVEKFKRDHNCRVTGLTWFRNIWTCDNGYVFKESP